MDTPLQKNKQFWEKLQFRRANDLANCFFCTYENSMAD